MTSRYDKDAALVGLDVTRDPHDRIDELEQKYEVILRQQMEERIEYPTVDSFWDMMAQKAFRDASRHITKRLEDLYDKLSDTAKWTNNANDYCDSLHERLNIMHEAIHSMTQRLNELEENNG